MDKNYEVGTNRVPKNYNKTYILIKSEEVQEHSVT